MIELHILALAAAVLAGVFIGLAVGTIFGERLAKEGFDRRLNSMTIQHRAALARAQTHSFNLGVKSVLARKEANNE